MKNFKRILSSLTAGLLLTVVGLFIATASVQAIPYQGENTPGLNSPQFNVYTGTPSVGDEPDFFRGKVEGAATYVNDVSSDCKVGTKFALRVYVHNAANQALNNNGTGPGVAHGTKVKVAIPGNSSANFGLSSTISSTNAGSISDGMSINCNGKQVMLHYINGSAQQYSVPGGTQALSDNIVTTGAPIGTNSPNGDVWGCWDQRVWVGLTVEVKEKPTPPPVVPPTPPTPTPPVTPTPPTTLLKTGTGDVMGIFVLASVAGALVYRFVVSRRVRV